MHLENYVGKDYYFRKLLFHQKWKTIWRTFDSCNNYKLPKSTSNITTTIHYWYADKEEKERKKDICFMKEKFPETKFTVLSNLGHGGFVLLKPEIFVKMIDTLK